jgi:hypothetical protein
MDSEFDKSARVGLLEILAWLNLIGAVATAIYIWASMGINKVGERVYNEPNPVAIVYISAALAEGIIGCVFLLIVVEIALDARATKKLLKKSLQKESLNESNT